MERGSAMACWPLTGQEYCQAAEDHFAGRYLAHQICLLWEIHGINSIGYKISGL